MLRFSAIVWNAQAAKVCQAADNCDITMVAALRLSDMSIQHVGHQGARLTASWGVYFRSSGKLFRGAMAHKSDRGPQNLRSEETTALYSFEMFTKTYPEVAFAGKGVDEVLPPSI